MHGTIYIIAGVQVAATSNNVAWQESVRAHVRLLYPKLIDTEIIIEQGRIQIPQTAGLGAAWQPELFQTDQKHYRVSTLDK